MKDLESAKRNRLCMCIVYENNNIMYVWKRNINTWKKEIYSLYKKNSITDVDTMGLTAYQEFYKYCGKEEIDRMKVALPLLNKWESYEQMHYSNYEYSNQKIYQDIYEFDVNSSFTYGAYQLNKDFDLLKEYLTILYDKKKNAKNQLDRSTYKNLQNYLIGYFGRIKEFVRVRSDIIYNSNFNIRKRIGEIVNKGGKVYISNTDSIVTDNIGADIMSKYIGKDIGQFKLECVADKLFYKSSNSYQIGNKVTYSGLKFFERENTDFFKDITAKQEGSFLKDFNYTATELDTDGAKLCNIMFDKIILTKYNNLGEIIEVKMYKPQIKEIKI